MWVSPLCFSALTCVSYFSCCVYTALTPQENSFQVIFITDGTNSYSVFTYNCELMEWDKNVTIGVNAGDDFYDNYDPSSSDIACLNLPDSNWTNVVYLLSNEPPELLPPSMPHYTVFCIFYAWRYPL